MNIRSAGPGNSHRNRLLILVVIAAGLGVVLGVAFRARVVTGGALSLMGVAQLPPELSDLPFLGSVRYIQYEDTHSTVWTLSGTTQAHAFEGYCTLHSVQLALGSPDQTMLRSYCKGLGIDSRPFVFEVDDLCQAGDGRIGRAAILVWYCPASGRLTVQWRE
jgi:hypothetical protein